MAPETRSSPKKGVALRSGTKRQALPTHQNQRPPKAPKSKKPRNKATAAAVAEAKKKTAEKEAEKDQPVVTVKEEATAGVPKRRLWTEDEDIAACKGFVNITMDPVVGSGQKGDQFWIRVQKKMYEFYESETEVQQQKQWNYKSVENRVSKILGKDTSKFNSYFCQVSKTNDSGWTPEMQLDAACVLYEQTEGKPFKYKVCARILHQCPKYKPMNEPTNEDGDSKPVAQVQGKGLPTPMGSKKAKKMAIVAKLEQDSVASTAHTNAVMAVAKASSDLNKSFDKKRRIDSLHKAVNSYIQLGMKKTAKEILTKIMKIEKDEEEEPARAPTPTASIPTSINVAPSGVAPVPPQEEEEEEAEPEPEAKADDNEADENDSNNDMGK